MAPPARWRAVKRTRSPDGAQRNPGINGWVTPDFAALHPGYLLSVLLIILPRVALHVIALLALCVVHAAITARRRIARFVRRAVGRIDIAVRPHLRRDLA